MNNDRLHTLWGLWKPSQSSNCCDGELILYRQEILYLLGFRKAASVVCNSLRNMDRVPAYLMAEHALAVGRIEVIFTQTVTPAQGQLIAVSLVGRCHRYMQLWEIYDASDPFRLQLIFIATSLLIPKGPSSSCACEPGSKLSFTPLKRWISKKTTHDSSYRNS